MILLWIFIEPLFLSTNEQNHLIFDLYKDIFMNTNYLKKSRKSGKFTSYSSCKL